MKKQLEFLKSITLLVFLSLLIGIVLQSCSDEKKKDETTKETLAGTGSIDCYKLDSVTINRYIRQSSTGYEALILQFSLNDIVDTKGYIGLIAYFEENHSDHATGKDSTTVSRITSSNCFRFKKGETYIVSNNYLAVDKLKAVIKGHESTYAYIKLTPIAGKRNKTSRHISFMIKAYDINDNPLEPVQKLKDGDDESNPSPPATPGFD